MPQYDVKLKVGEQRGVKPKKGGTEMEWQIIVVLVVIAPLILFPVVFIWYVNIAGFYTMLRERRKEKAAAKERIGAVAHQHPAEATAVTGKH